MVPTQEAIPEVGGYLIKKVKKYQIILSGCDPIRVFYAFLTLKVTGQIVVFKVLILEPINTRK